MSLISKTSIGLAFFIALIPGYSFAQVLDCERLRLESRGFVSVSAAESWMPERLSISIDGNVSIVQTVDDLMRFSEVITGPVMGCFGLGQRDGRANRLAVQMNNVK